MSLFKCHHIVIGGVAGCGKSTVGQALSDLTGLPYLDADDLHSEVNVKKMRGGQPLIDDDRWPWLDACAGALAQTDAGLILGCSALRRVYRDRLRDVSGMPDLAFVQLSGDRDLLFERMSMRTDHYMPPSLLVTQLETLEPLEADETAMTIRINQSVGDIVQEIVDGLGQQT